MSIEDFPVRPASRPSTELQRLASAYETPEIRQRLDADLGESTLFSARSGLKPEEFELRSGRPYDPDAAFFAGSVSRNFLDVGGETASGVGLRLPRPIEGARSLRDAARGDTPSILATAGRIEELPGNVRSRGEITDFLESEANTGRFYTRQGDNQSGEAEAITAAEGAESTTDPWTGSGQIEPGEATQFVEMATPMRTELRGEQIPIQFARQQTGDVTPRSQQQGLFGGERLAPDEFLADERGQIAPGTRGDRQPGEVGDSESIIRPESYGDGVPYRPGGRPGTPAAPVAPSSPFGESDGVDSSPVAGSGFSSPFAPTDTTGGYSPAQSQFDEGSAASPFASPTTGGADAPSPFASPTSTAPETPSPFASPTAGGPDAPSPFASPAGIEPEGPPWTRVPRTPDGESDPADAPAPRRRDEEPLTPEYANPIASGVGDVFGIE